MQGQGSSSASHEKKHNQKKITVIEAEHTCSYFSLCRALIGLSSFLGRVSSSSTQSLKILKALHAFVKLVKG